MPDSGFGTGLANLVTALNTDFDWLREHTRYLQRAIEWEKGGRAAERLLSGNKILEANHAFQKGTSGLCARWRRLLISDAGRSESSRPRALLLPAQVLFCA